MKDSNLSRWLYQNRCFLGSDNQKNITHLCLDGGRLNIPDNLMEDFFKQYAKGIIEGEKYYLCECITPVIKFYCDLDFILDKELDIPDIKNFVLSLNKTIVHHFKENFSSIVCVAPSKNVQKDKQKKIKTGVHIIWSGLHLDIDKAYSLSRVMVDNMKTLYPDYDWENIIDEQVYNNGLRMIGSRKVSNKRRAIKNTKEYEIIKIDEGRTYEPKFCINEYGDILETNRELNTRKNEDIAGLLTGCSIRSWSGEKSLEPVEPLPLLSLKKKKTSSRVDTDIEKKILDRVESFIRYQTIIQWNSPLRQLKKQGNFYIAKIDSMYCLNIQREHNSCGIYFQITDQGLFQRCFCRCETLEGRNNGYCSKFKSTVFPLPLEVRKMLFPNSRKPRKTQTKSIQTTDSFGSNMLLKSKETLKDYLRMSMNTITAIEKKCR